jgi:hypothetical protein
MEDFFREFWNSLTFFNLSVLFACIGNFFGGAGI